MLAVDDAAAAPAASKKAAGPNEVDTATIICRAVNLSALGNASANSDIAYAVERTLNEDPMFSAKLADTINVDDSGTFTFGINLTLKQPLKY